MAKAKAPAAPVVETPVEPAKPAGNRRYKVLSDAFIDGHRFRAGTTQKPNIVVLRDGLTMKALEPLELTDDPLSIPDRAPKQTFPGAAPFPTPMATV